MAPKKKSAPKKAAPKKAVVGKGAVKSDSKLPSFLAPSF